MHLQSAFMGCAHSKSKSESRPPTPHVSKITLELTRYTRPEGIWAALETGSVRLVKMTWLISQAKAGKVLPRRQELPEAAFISVIELKRMWSESGHLEGGGGNIDGVLPIIAISSMWLTPTHPDPDGRQLSTVAATLERERANYLKASPRGNEYRGFQEMGIFWEYD